MGNEAFVESVMHEIIFAGRRPADEQPLFQRASAGQAFKKRLAGFAVQHYLSNHAINKGLAFLHG